MPTGSGCLHRSQTRASPHVMRQEKKSFRLFARSSRRPAAKFSENIYDSYRVRAESIISSKHPINMSELIAKWKIPVRHVATDSWQDTLLGRRQIAQLSSDNLWNGLPSLSSNDYWSVASHPQVSQGFTRCETESAKSDERRARLIRYGKARRVCAKAISTFCVPQSRDNEPRARCGLHFA